MKRHAFATLQRQRPRARQCQLELLLLEPAADGSARCLVTLRQGPLQHGVLVQAAESTLTPTPCGLAEAERRARDFIRRRLAEGDTLLRQQGFDDLAAPAPATDVPALPAAPAAPARHAPGATAALSPAIAALLARLRPDAWRLLDAGRRARTVWRLGECADPAPATPQARADQAALRACVPQLVGWLESGDDLLDLCLAMAMGRLADPGAAVALQALAERGRSPATRRMAHQAWLLLQTPEARADHARGLLAGWREPLARWCQADDDRGAALAELQARMETTATPWPRLLGEWYDAALAEPELRAGLLHLVGVLPLVPGPWQALRQLTKAAELRLDTELLGRLHARFENSRHVFNGSAYYLARGFYAPGTQRWVGTPAQEELARPDARLAFSSRTRQHFRLRGWRQLRRLAALQHSQAPALAVQLLLGLVDEELPAPHVEQRHHHDFRTRQGRTELRHFERSAHWLLVPALLLPRLPQLLGGQEGRRWYTAEPLDLTRELPQRTEGLPALWDAHPQALLQLALASRSALVQAVVARALQDHRGFVASQPPATLQALLQSPYAPTVRVALEVARAELQRLQHLPDLPAQVPWLCLLARSSDAGARELALVHVAGHPAAFANQPVLVAALLLSEHANLRRQGEGLATLAAAQPDSARALLAELQAALLATDAEQPALAECCAALAALLAGALQPAAQQAAVEPLLGLLEHPAPAVLQLAVDWLLLHGHALALLPPATLAGLLGHEQPRRRAQGVRLFAALPDEVLQSQGALLCDLAVHPHAGVRTAVQPALLRRAQADSGFAQQLAARLHAVLFTAEPADPEPQDDAPGLHAQALQWLTEALAAQAPARDAGGAWRALQASSRGAQRYGAWALAQLGAADFSLRQQATLARHALVQVRAWARAAIDATLPAQPTPEQAEQLLPLADATFDDALAHAHQVLGERLPDESLPVELLVAWIDHPRPWMQALGRQRLTRRMRAEEAALVLTRLAQHPSTAVQLFVTQWLLDMPRTPATEFAARLQALTPYFLTVLSHVHRARAAKARITAFLREASATPEAAAVVAEIFARQVVTASLTDKPQYVAGLRDIAARHPQIALPCLQWEAAP